FTNYFAVDFVFDLVAGDDDLKRRPFSFLDTFVLFVSRNDVELGAAQEHVVVALLTRLEVESDRDILAEFLRGLDVQVPFKSRIVDQDAIDDFKAALVSLCLAAERFLLAARFLPAIEILAVE